MKRSCLPLLGKGRVMLREVPPRKIYSQNWALQQGSQPIHLHNVATSLWRSKRQIASHASSASVEAASADHGETEVFFSLFFKPEQTD